MSAVRARSPNEVEIAERKSNPGVWTVEAIMGDGAIEQALFAGSRSEVRAREYAQWKYPHHNST